jgi:hypothetical protein
MLSSLSLPLVAVCALGLVSPLVGKALIGRRRTADARADVAAVRIPRAELWLRVAVAIVLAAGIMQGAAVLPALASGLLLALPINGNVLPCFTLPRHGAASTAALLRGFMWGVFGFVSFFVALVALLPLLGAGLAYTLAWLAALLVAVSVYAARWRVRIRQGPAPAR